MEGVPLGMSANFSSMRSSTLLVDQESFLQAAKELAPLTAEKYPQGRHLLVIYNPMTSMIST